jgi:hypothetical protein
MQHPLRSLTIKVGLPVLVGQFLYDLITSGLPSAAGHFPRRAASIFAVLLLWAAFRGYRERKNRTFR